MADGGEKAKVLAANDRQFEERSSGKTNEGNAAESQSTTPGLTEQKDSGKSSKGDAAKSQSINSGLMERIGTGKSNEEDATKALPTNSGLTEQKDSGKSSKGDAAKSQSINSGSMDRIGTGKNNEEDAAKALPTNSGQRFKVRLDNDDLMKKLDWTYGKKKKSNLVKPKKDPLSNCCVELTAANGVEAVQITWDQSDSASSNVTSVALTELNAGNLKPQCATFTQLRPNTTYTATFTYENNKKKKEVHLTFNTGPEVPSEINMEGNNTLTWRRAGGADSYLVKVASEERTTRENKLSLSDGWLAKGLGAIEVSITAISKSGLQKSEKGKTILSRCDGVSVAAALKSPTTTTIETRGNDSPKNTTISVNSNEPHRSLCIAWEKPTADVSSYECTLYCSTDDRSAVQAKETSEREVTFKGLKQNTEYYAIIRSIKIDGKRGNSCRTNTCKTKSGKKKMTQTEIERIGSVSPPCLRWIRSKEGNIVVLISWQNPTINPQLDDDFELTSFEMECSEWPSGKATHDLKKFPFQKNFEYKYFLELSPGKKYSIGVAAIYIDRDNGRELRATTRVEYLSGPGKVEITRAMPIKGDESHAFSVEWKQKEGCSEYRVIITDDDNKSIRTIYTKQTEIVVTGLSPRRKYKITVTGGTGDRTGFGSESDPVTVTTGNGRPLRVRLCQNEEKPESTLTLSFEETGERHILYLACLKDDLRMVQKKDSKGSPIVFTDLSQNTQYHATVQVVYENRQDQGDEVTSNKVWTVPAPPSKFSAEAVKEDDITLSLVKLQWEADSRCNTHQINVMRANTEETKLVVKGRNECKYRCLDRTSDYTFTVQTTNSSGIFSEPSHEDRVSFPPTRVEKVLAAVNEDTGKIEVKWDKPDKAHSYRIIVIADGTNVGSDIVTETHYEIQPDNTRYKKYEFMVYPLDKDQQKAESTHSSVVEITPPDVKLTVVEPNPNDPTTSLIIKWERLPFSDVEYELQISSLEEHGKYQEETSMIYRGLDSCAYVCQSPESKYKVRIRSKRGRVPGRLSRPITCQLGSRKLPYGLQLHKVKGLPRRLNLTWKEKDDEKCIINAVTLYEKGREDPVQPFEVAGKTAKFRHLKSLKEYYAVIKVTVDGQEEQCQSNQVMTEKDTQGVRTKSKDFPGEIWMEKNNEGVNYLKWEEVDLGDAFRIIGYAVTIVKLGGRLYGMRNKTEISEKMVTETSIALPVLKPNSKYRATIELKIWSVDGEKEEILCGKSHDFCERIDPPVLHDPKYNGNFVVFEWDAIAAANAYNIEIKDAGTHVTLREKEKCSATQIRIKMEKELRVGRSCRIGLSAIGSKTSSVKWYDWIIGGNKVPRDVTVAKNSENPRRYIDIRFTKPQTSENPLKYLITACPSTGRKKAQESKTTHFIFKDLRSGTPYYFEILAQYLKEKSLPSISAQEITDQCPGTINPGPLMNFEKGVTADLSGAKIRPININAGKPTEERVIVQDAKIDTINDTGKDKDVVQLRWSAPSFSNNAENYIVENYIWKVVDGNGKEVDSGETTEYSTEKIGLILGRTYKFTITAKYENIDLDKPNNTSETKDITFQTRPCMPTQVSCYCQLDDEKLVVRWNSAEGAEGYKVELYRVGQLEPHLVADRDKLHNVHAWELNRDVEFGAEVYATVTAVGSGGKQHIAKSGTEIIGGDSVPKQARATNDPESPTTAAVVQWEPPITTSDGYEIQAIPLNAAHRNGPCDIGPVERCTSDEHTVRMKGMQPGTEYIFKVFAVHQGKRSAGCRTNQIQTTPGPGKVEITRAMPNKGDESHAFRVEWKQKEGCSEYRVIVTDDDNKSIRTIYTKQTEIVVTGLFPRRKYMITVAGGTGNRTGFGSESDPATVTTGNGRPLRVRLRRNEESTLTLSFEETGERDISYFACLKDDQKIVDKKDSKSSPIVFNNLSQNTQYHATVQVVYENWKDKGDTVTSDKVWTVPAPPTKLSAEAVKENDITLPLVKLQWEADIGCNTHRINVMRASTEETKLVVKGRNECEYRCLDHTCDYTFTVQTTNSSGIFSEPSHEERVSFPPAKIEKVLAGVNKDTGKIEVKWDKPDNKAHSYSITVIADGTNVWSDIVSETHYEILPDNTRYKKYEFMVYPLDKDQQKAESTHSSVVEITPPDVKLKVVEPNPNDPTTSLIIKWERLPFSDAEYELQISPLGEHGKYLEETSLVYRGLDSCVYVCRSPGSKYKVHVQSKRGGVPGRLSKPMTCQLAPTAPTNVEARIKKTDGKNHLMLLWRSIGTFVLKYEVEIYTHVLFDETEILWTKRTVDNDGKFVEAMEANVGPVEPGKFYRCAIRAVHDGFQGQVASSRPVFAEWEKPEELSVTLDENNPPHKARITWARPSFTDTFEMTLTDTSGTEIKKLLTDTEWALENGKPGEEYDVSIRCGLGDRFSSERITRRFRLAPEPPAEVVVMNEIGERPKIKISVKFRGPKPDHFIYCVKENKTKQIIKGPLELKDENLVIDDKLHHGNIYEVSVQSVFTSIKNFPSEEATSRIQIPPEKVGAVSVEEDNGLLIAYWPELKPKVDHYVISWARGTDENQIRKLNTPKFEMPTLGVGETVTMRVAGVNVGGQGEFSDKIVHKTVPSPPTNVRIEVSRNEPDTSLLIMYTDEARDPRKKYGIYVNDMEDGKTESLEYRISGLTPGSTNKISVSSIVDERESKHYLATEPGVTVPGRVEKIEGEITSDRHMILRWKHPNDIPPDYYKIESIVNEDQPKEGIAENPEFRLLQLEKDARYKFRVSAVNSSGQSKWSKQMTCWTGPPPPRKVTACVEIDENGHRYMDVRIDDEQDPAKEYFIAVVDDRDRKKTYRTKSLSRRIHNFGELRHAISFSVGVYSKKDNVRSEVVTASQS